MTKARVWYRPGGFTEQLLSEGAFGDDVEAHPLTQKEPAERAERGQFISQFISDDDVVGIQLDIEQCLEMPDLPQQVRDVLGLAHNVLTAILSGARMLSASQVRLKSPPPV
jgi:hypothetical protein